MLKHYLHVLQHALACFSYLKKSLSLSKYYKEHQRTGPTEHDMLIVTCTHIYVLGTDWGAHVMNAPEQQDMVEGDDALRSWRFKAFNAFMSTKSHLQVTYKPS